MRPRNCVTTRELPTFGQLKSAEKALIWGLIHTTGAALESTSEVKRNGAREGIARTTMLSAWVLVSLWLFYGLRIQDLFSSTGTGG